MTVDVDGDRWWNPPGLVMPDPWVHPAVDPADALAILPHGAADADRGMWLAVRRTGLGGSDASALYGMHKYTSPIEVWEEKRGTLPLVRETGEPALWGRLFEPVIRDEYARREHIRIEPSPMFRSVRWPWMCANPDGLVLMNYGGGTGGGWMPNGEGYEGKTANHWLGSEWSDGQVADHAEAQAHWCMAVTGAHGWRVACLVGGQSPRFRYVERDDDIVEQMVDMSRSFWFDHVVGGAPPPADGSVATENFLRERFPSFVDQAPPVVANADDVTEITTGYAAASSDESSAKAAKREATNRARQLLGEATTLVDENGYVIATRNPTGKFDAERFRDEHPDIAARFTRRIDVIDETALREHDEKLFAMYRGPVLLVKKPPTR